MWDFQPPIKEKSQESFKILHKLKKVLHKKTLSTHILNVKRRGSTYTVRDIGNTYNPAKKPVIFAQKIPHTGDKASLDRCG